MKELDIKIDGEYFSCITIDYTSKNKAHKAANEVAHMDYNRRVISGHLVKSFIDSFKESIEFINHANKRCKPLDLDIHQFKSIDEVDIYIQISGNFHMTLYLVEGDGVLPF